MLLHRAGIQGRDRLLPRYHKLPGIDLSETAKTCIVDGTTARKVLQTVTGPCPTTKTKTATFDASEKSTLVGVKDNRPGSPIS